MIFTARQLEQLHRAHGEVIVPYRAKLTPLARDWVKLKNITIGYSDGDAPMLKPHVDHAAGPTATAPAAAPLLWWCDGASGVAKAALMSAGREVHLVPMSMGQDPRAAISAVKHLCGEVKANRAQGGVFIASNAAAALLYANRCGVLRAILGTSQSAIEQAMRELAPNVLVLEDQRQTIQQAKNMILRFARANRTPDEKLARELKELAS